MAVSEVNSESKLATSRTDSYYNDVRLLADERAEGKNVAHDTRLEWRLNLLCEKPVPINVPGEERMALDFISTVVTETLRRVAV